MNHQTHNNVQKIDDKQVQFQSMDAKDQFQKMLNSLNTNDYYLPTLNFESNMNSFPQPSGLNTLSFGSTWEPQTFNNGTMTGIDFDFGSESTQSFQKTRDNIYSTCPGTPNKLNARHNNTGTLPDSKALNSHMKENQPTTMSEMTCVESLISQFTSNVNRVANYKVDSNRAYRCLPYMLQVLYNSNSSEVDLMKSGYLLFLMSRKEACRYILYGCSQLPKVIVFTLCSTTNETIRRHMVGTIYHLYSNLDFLQQIKAQENSLKILCQLLSSSSDAVRFYAIATLHTILVKFPDSRSELNNLNCLQSVFPSIFSKTIGVVTLVVDVILHLAMDNIQIQNLIVSSGYHIELLKFLKGDTYEKLLFCVCRLTKMLSTNASLKKIFVTSGIMKMLSDLLLSNSRRVACCCLWALRNFSDYGSFQQDLDNLIVICFKFIVAQIVDVSTGSSAKYLHNESKKTVAEPSLVMCACGILANLTCNNSRNKELLVKFQCMGTLLTICLISSSYKEIMEPAICTIRHLLSGHNLSNIAVDGFHANNGFTIISKILDKVSSKDVFFPQLLKAISGIFTSIALTGQYASDFKNCSIIQKIMKSIKVSLELLMERLNSDKNVEGDQKILKSLSLYQNVIEEGTLFLYTIMGNYYGNGTEIELFSPYFTDECIEILIQLVFSKNETIGVYVVGILELLSKIQPGVNLISKKIFISHVDGSEGAQYSSAVLTQLFGLKNSSNSYLRTAVNSLLNEWSNIFNIRLSGNSKMDYSSIGSLSISDPFNKSRDQARYGRNSLNQSSASGVETSSRNFSGNTT